MKKIIWKSDFDIEDFEEDIAEQEILTGKMSDEEKYSYVDQLNYFFLEDERMNLDVQLEHPIIIIADLGLWNGRKSGYKMIESGNIKHILQPHVNGESHFEVYYDGYNVRATESHHDGTNYYLFREVKNMANIEKFQNIIMKNLYTKAQLNYFTRSLATAVGRVYGWK